MKKWLYSFGFKNEKQIRSKSLLGGKGYGLAVLSSLNLPVPPGFTIITEACAEYYKNKENIPEDIWSQVIDCLNQLQSITNKAFSSKCPLNSKPLLLSVRSGAITSMPGMMDTVLNLGLNDYNTEALAQATNDKRFAYDSYRRFIEMYADVVMNINHNEFAAVMSYFKQKQGIEHDWQLSHQDLLSIIKNYKQIILKVTGETIPEDVFEQLRSAINAVFASWNSDRAVRYRELNSIPNDFGTAVNIQSMVFGNMGPNSLTGVMFTRNPSSGEKELFGEFLSNSQGEDIVSGVKTPRQITNAGKASIYSNEPSLEESNKKIFSELVDTANIIETHFKDMQDIEFTAEEGKLWLLQTRSGKRSARSTVKIAIDMLNEGMLNVKEALSMIKPSDIEKLLHSTIDDKAPLQIITKGLPASPGAASGAVVFTPEQAERLSKIKKVILVRRETSPEDIGGMIASEGILTVKGGMTSHAAVVARGMGKPCICGAGSIIIDEVNDQMDVNGSIIKAGDYITINGSTGDLILGEVATVRQKTFPEFLQLINLTNSIKRLEVRANAETERDVAMALEFGAIGIGLCRTEHMFFEPDRVLVVRQMIFADCIDKRIQALEKLLPMQRNDFKIIFKAMKDKPVTIRLLDPPLHEFLPNSEKEIEDIAQYLSLSILEIKNRLRSLAEINPMLGHRGARLAITFPEIYSMQLRAIFEAASEIGGVVPEIMMPLIFDANEVIFLKQLVSNAQKNFAPDINYLFGVMIELPRAALQAGEIAKLVDFCSFGTNDLTQTTLGISRDDATKFLGAYKEKGILLNDPFISLDKSGVGELIKIAVNRARAANPNIKIGVCGEHGGDPESIKFFDTIDIDYISCSPYRVPIAKLSAALTTIHNDF